MSFWGNRKPPFGTRIDWNHPLCSGLVLYYLHTNECGWQDCVGGYELTQIKPETTVDRAGHSRYYNGTTYADVVTYDVRFAIQTDITVTCFHTFWNTSGTQRLVSRRASGDGNVYIISPNGTNYRFLWTTALIATGGTLDANIPTMVSGTYTPGTAGIWKNGALAGSTSGTQTPFINVGRGLAFGRDVDTETGCTANIHMVAIHSRALSAEEIAWLHAEPYAMFEPLNLEVFYSIPSGVTFNPAWAMNSNQVLYV